jgi:hypothetical protein
MRYLFICIILFQGITLAIAQSSSKHHTKKTPEQKAEAQMAKLPQELSLTPDQTQQIKAIYVECDQQLDSLNRQVKAVRQKRKAGIKQVLTPDQYNIYIQSQKKKSQAKQTGASE